MGKPSAIHITEDESSGCNLYRRQDVMREIINMDTRIERQSIRFLELFIADYADLLQIIDLLIEYHSCWREYALQS